MKNIETEHSPLAERMETLDSFEPVDGSQIGLNEEVGPRLTFRVDEPWDQWGWAQPTEFLVCSLYSAQKRDRTLLIQERLNTNTNVHLVVTGESLFQYDGDVFALAVHKGRAGDPVTFRLRDFVVELRGAGKVKMGSRKRKKALPADAVENTAILPAVQPSSRRKSRPIDSVGGTAILPAVQSIARLTGFMVDFQVKDDDTGEIAYGYSGCLFDAATVLIDGEQVPVNDDIARRPDVSRLIFTVILNPTLSVLFQKTRRTYLNPALRGAFCTSPLVAWLYGFLRARSSPWDLPLSYYREKSGATSKPGEFTRLMKVARKRLRQAKIIYSSRMVEGRLHFDTKKPEKLVTSGRRPSIAKKASPP
jgi:hypothetical protein